ncbi:hypothetical protein [Arhodomonas sp. SL1]|uniref:hypothetical protein n=1 Tax=Arhodomonas sp. SL1 TaxID=3425691 RepID=UPI003F882C26
MEDSAPLHPRRRHQPLHTPTGARYQAATGDVVQLCCGGEWIDVRLLAVRADELVGVALARYPSDGRARRPPRAGERRLLRFREDHIWRCVELAR